MKRFLLFFAPLLWLSLTGAVGLRRPGVQQIDKSSVFFAPVQSQTTEKRAGSITGRIVVGGNPAPGIAVMLLRLDSNSSLRTPVANTKTDEHGRYQFNGVAPGSYDIFPSAPELVLPQQGRYGQPGKTVAVEGGEAVEGVDFIVAQGGVVTGRVTQADGRPIVGEAVTLNKIGEQGHMSPFYPSNYRVNEIPMTDDRGEYRVMGVPSGHYLVSVGVSYGLTRAQYESVAVYKQTFHPGVTDRSKAITIDVKEGAVLSGVDITVGPALKTYAVTGRILDAEGKPLPRIKLIVITESEDGKSKTHTSGDLSSDSKGEFRFEGALPGHYQIAPRNDPSSNSYGEPIAFEVKDKDVSGLEIKMSRGSSISGLVVVEGSKDAILPSKLFDLGLMAHVVPPSRDSEGAISSSRINSDGSFRISGLRPGRAIINLMQLSPSAPKEFLILRIESNGVEQHNGIEVGQGEQITGARVVISSGAGVIRGEVEINGGQLDDVRLYLLYQRSGVDSQSYGRVDVDARGHFVIEKLFTGNYELLIGPMSVEVTGDAGGKTMSRMPTVKQTVSVRSGAESAITLVLTLRP
jgi:protocatechuate 3,4-dioxygenase beta subunit